jgi:diguanylate cyclase (GGDEF)-like protein
MIRSSIQVDSEAATGLNNLQVEGSDFYFAVFSDLSGRDGYLVWKRSTTSQPHSESPASKVDQSSYEENKSWMPIVDFLVRSAQQTSRWFKRLDKTQALLYQDEVTGLYNYRYLDVAIDSELKRLHRFHAPFSLLFIDLDSFKSINDEHGHITGSSVLKQVGSEIKLAVRDVDNVIRYGGDEFVVVLIGANTRQAMQAAERVRSRVQAASFKTEDAKFVKLTVSIGVASCPEHGRDRKTILKMADETMYVSKKNGKNRVMTVHVAPNTESTQTVKTES